MNERARRLGRRQLVASAAATVPIGAAALGPSAQRQAAAMPTFQETPPDLSATLAYVSGSGSVRVPPDQATVVIGIDVERETLSQAQAEATSQATAILEAITAAGVARADIRTTNFSVDVVRERRRDAELPERGAVRGFQVSNAVEVTVRDVDALGRILDDAIAAGANEVRRIAFSVADPAAAAAQARAQAVADARSRADALAGAAGLTVSRVVEIAESFAPPPMPVELASAAGTAIADAAAPVPIEAGTDEIVVEVQVTYELT